jgi:hypothetical protein
MILYEIAKRLAPYNDEDIFVTKIKETIVIETPDWVIYLTDSGVQYNRRTGKWTTDTVETCPDELFIAHQLLGMLIERLKNENHNPLLG